jgi:hypothetical protein
MKGNKGSEWKRRDGVKGIRRGEGGNEKDSEEKAR